MFNFDNCVDVTLCARYSDHDEAKRKLYWKIVKYTVIYVIQYIFAIQLLSVFIDK